MSFAKRAAKSGLWFAGFRLIIQSFSWIITIAIARILVPADYGLMAMASILTGYVEIFSELGLGAAIIQRERESTKEELSSIFWFSMIVGTVFSILSFLLAYPTAWLFDEPRVIPITHLISVLFIISAVMIVPYNILSREVKFKEIGAIQLSSVVVSSLSMLWMANKGYGVWTLINGTIIQRVINIILTFWAAKWRPMFHFLFDEAKPFLKFGINIAGSRSLFYVFQKSDKFVVGKMFNAQFLGYYSFAMQLASIPTDKIVSIVNQVSFPVFARYQNDQRKSQELYLKSSKYIALIVIPMFLLGVFFAKDIILTLLGPKWASIIFIFQVLCVVQLFVSIITINSAIHNAQGNPKLVFRFHLANTILMPVSLYIASRFGFNALAFPWIIIYPTVSIWWTYITLKKLNISIRDYLKNILSPLIATIAIISGIKLIHLFFYKIQIITNNLKLLLLQELLVAGMLYFIYLYFIEKASLHEIWNLRKT